MSRKTTSSPFDKALLQAVNDWQRGGSHKQKIKRGCALKEVCRALPSRYRSVDGVCYRQEAHEKDRVWELIADNQLPETIASWTTSLEIAQEVKGGVPPEPLKGIIFRVRPKQEQVIVNLSALYADEEFLSAVQLHRKEISGFYDGIHKYGDSQKEVVLELGSLDTADAFSYGGFVGTKEQLIAAYIAEHGREPSTALLPKLEKSWGKPHWLTEAGTRAVLERTLGKAAAKNWWGRSVKRRG